MLLKRRYVGFNRSGNYDKNLSIYRFHEPKGLKLGGVQLVCYTALEKTGSTLLAGSIRNSEQRTANSAVTNLNECRS